MRQRLDVDLVRRHLAQSRSQAENYVKLGAVYVNNKVVRKAGTMISPTDVIEVRVIGEYVSRAGLKLASVTRYMGGVDFSGAIVLDVGSSTGGFTDYALQHGAKKVYAVDVGTEQLHPSLRGDARIELHEKTDIRDFKPNELPDIVVIDVSFISLREILPYVTKIISPDTSVIAMVKPQFEAGKGQVNKGVIKNDKIRRQILADFEGWVWNYFVIQDKRDSEVAGQKGNVERFYALRLKTPSVRRASQR